MKILIISGFLGAGKTTFIQELIKRTDIKPVVLENEYGSTDVDEQIITSDANADVMNLTEGCVCCTKSEDMISSVITIESTLSPEYLIVEPSGVGALSKVIRNLQKIEYERIQLLRPITIVDAERFRHDNNAFSDIYQDQIKTAGIIVISKPDHLPEELYEEVKKTVNEINPKAEVLKTHYRQMGKEFWNSLLTTAYSGELIENDPDELTKFETFTINNCSVPNPTCLLWLLEQVLTGRFGQVVRAKGVLPAGKEWIRFDIASEKASITGFETDEERPAKAECVWIGNGLDRLGIMQYITKSGIIDGNAGDNKSVRSIIKPVISGRRG